MEPAETSYITIAWIKSAVAFPSMRLEGSVLRLYAIFPSPPVLRALSSLLSINNPIPVPPPSSNKICPFVGVGVKLSGLNQISMLTSSLVQSPGAF